jgi:Skp family chaperone for outer membrane proteins
MSSDELQELHEHAEHARHTGMARVSLTMAVLAVLVAAVSLLGHRTHTEELVLQNRVTDQWAYFQAKSIRRHADQTVVDLVSVLTAKDPAKDKDAEQIAKVREKYQAEAERYRDEQNELEAEAKKLEAEAEKEHKRADRYDLGEVFLEIALVVTSITLLSGRRTFWYAGIVIGAVGVSIAASGLLIH